MAKIGKTIVVLGGGIGGVAAVHELSKRLTREHKIVLIEKRKTHLYQPGLLWTALGYKKLSEFEASFDSFDKKRIEVISAEILKINPEKKTVKTDQGVVNFDFALICLGAELAPWLIPGLTDYGHSFYDPENVENFFQAINDFQGKKIAIVVSRLPYKCPAAPYEMAFLLDEFLKRKKLRDKISISFFTPEPMPLPAAGVHVGKFVLKALGNKNIRYKSNHVLKEVSKRDLIFDAGEYAYDLLLYVPPHQSPKAIRESGLAGPRGWIPVDPRTLKTNFTDIYAVGDCAEIPIGGEKFLPKAGVFANGQAEIAAQNVVLETINAKDRETYPGFGSCFLEIEAGKAAYFSGHFYQRPIPKIRLWNPTLIAYWIKHSYAKYWKWKWFRE